MVPVVALFSTED